MGAKFGNGEDDDPVPFNRQLRWGLGHYKDALRARKGRDRGTLLFYQIELEIK